MESHPKNEPCRKRVLVVDDQYGIRLLLQELLKGAGIETLLAANGQQALDLLQENNPGLALIDMRIPGIKGNELLKKIKAENSEIKIIMMTAYVDPKIENESKKNGAIACFSKPFDLGKLLQTIQEVLPA